MNEMTTVTTAKDWASDQEVRWCPGCGDYAVLKAVQRTMPDLGVAREKTVFVSRHRLLEPLSLLHGDLRLPHHPRPRAGGRDRDQARQSRARRVDHHRRRRRAVDRRQPHDARAAPQPRLPDPAVQQRDLRPDQGPIFADQPDRHALALDPVRLGRPAGRRPAPSRSARARGSSPAASTSTRICPTCSRPPTPTRAPASSKSSRIASSTMTTCSRPSPHARSPPTSSCGCRRARRCCSPAAPRASRSTASGWR